MYQLNYGISEADAYARVKWAAERAIALDERSADAHVAFAIALWWQRNWPGAERELRRAIELNRNHATAHAWYVLLLTGMGRLDEADRLSRRAAELDPFAPVPLGNRARACYLLRNFDCAVEYYGKAVEVSPTFATSYLGLGISYSALHQHDPAIRAMQQAAALRSDFLADLAYTLARAGRRQEARQTLQRAKQKPAFEPFYVARVHAALGEADSAFAWLERSSWHWPHRAVRFDPALDPIRGDPRFAQLSARIDREMGMRP
jgi:tetratricopeptide (TPR) repeat protein